MSRARRLAFACPLAVALVCALTAPTPSSAALSDIPTPTVSDPIPVAATSKTFLAADPALLAKYGYVEREYYVTGNAYEYTGTAATNLVNATKVTTGGPNNDGTHPYRTRIVVRRPADPGKYNGTTLMEWYNVTAQFDIEWNWFNDPEYLMRRGYAFVGVSAQRAGVNALKGWNPGRYGTLDVTSTTNTVPANGPTDTLSFDIFGSIAKALKGFGLGRDPMNGLETDRVIASGESQSGGRLNSYYNTIQPLHDVVDAFLITVAGGVLRSDRPQDKAIRVLSENEFKGGAATDPDTTGYRRWEVAGGSHLPFKAFMNFAPTIARDLPSTPATADCGLRPLSRVQWPYVANRAIDALVRWDRDGTVPATAPRAEYATPTQLARNADGNALGSIRLPEIDVPVATMTGSNTALNATGFSPFCNLLGSFTKFSSATLEAKYADYGAYVDAVAPKAQAVADAGFVLQEDVAALNAEAQRFTRLRPAAPTASGTTADGSFGLAWRGPDAAATATTYDVEKRSSAAGADFTSAADDVADTKVDRAAEDEGTFVYRVRGVTTVPALYPDPQTVETTPWSEASAPVKVDRSGPQVALNPDRAPGASGWFKDAVTVTTAATDPALPDGSAGVGVDGASVTGAQTRSGSGTYLLSGTARDAAGNATTTSRTFSVDAEPPTLNVVCPGSLFVGERATVTVAASDGQSGLASDPSGTPLVDTATAGPRFVVATAVDQVGHVVTRACVTNVRVAPAAGAKGATGPRGKTGKPGRDAKVTCRSTGSRRVRCTVTTKAKASVRLAKAGRTVAHAQRTGSGAVTLRSTQRLKGRYTLSVTIEGKTVQTGTITL